MPTKSGIYIGMTEEQERIHRLRRNAMGVTWAEYLDRLAELADAKVLRDHVKP